TLRTAARRSCLRSGGFSAGSSRIFRTTSPYAFSVSVGVTAEAGVVAMKVSIAIANTVTRLTIRVTASQERRSRTSGVLRRPLERVPALHPAGHAAGDVVQVREPLPPQR